MRSFRLGLGHMSTCACIQSLLASERACKRRRGKASKQRDLRCEVCSKLRKRGTERGVSARGTEGAVCRDNFQRSKQTRAERNKKKWLQIHPIPFNSPFSFFLFHIHVFAHRFRISVLCVVCCHVVLCCWGFVLTAHLCSKSLVVVVAAFESL